MKKIFICDKFDFVKGNIMDFDKEKLISFIKRLNEPKILVVGDLAIDEMIYGDTERISREAPVLILAHTRTKLILGAASNAAHNVSTLNNGKVKVVGVCGDDYQSLQLKETFKEGNVNCDYLITDPFRKTTTKTRISGSISTSITQQIVRIDRQTKEPLSSQSEQLVLENIEKAREPLFTTKPELERSGMGFMFMEMFMNKVDVISEPGKGTTVIMEKKLKKVIEKNSIKSSQYNSKLMSHTNSKSIGLVNLKEKSGQRA